MAAAPPDNPVLPLCVDLDGTLIRSDSLWELLLLCVRAEPRLIFVFPFWLLSGRAAFKEKVAARVTAQVSHYPYNQDLLQLLRSATDEGRPLVLVTAASERVAHEVAAHLGIFSSVLASDAAHNLKGREKARVLVETYGERGYDYAGDSAADLHVWRSARGAILVGQAVRYRAQLEAGGCEVRAVFPRRRSLLRALLREMRVYQWAKNVLIFLPVLLAHKLNDVAALVRCAYAFGAFSLVASSVYVINDLLDLAADRRHPVKRNRPLASGDLPIPAGIALEFTLLTGAVVLAWMCGSPRLIAVLVLYLIASTAYSFRLKHLAMMDVMVLSGLYTSRVIAGGAAARVPLSTWLLAFSIFLFLSMALLKRVSE